VWKTLKQRIMMNRSTDNLGLFSSCLRPLPSTRPVQKLIGADSVYTELMNTDWGIE
jgi:hypothetical protein